MAEFSRRDIIAATAAGAMDARGTEIEPTAEKDNLTFVTSTVATVSQFTASRYAKSICAVSILGFHKPGIGAFSVRRVNSNPLHKWKFRSKDRFLANGSTDPANGGWWEGYPDNGSSIVYPEQFGAVGDGVTDDYPAFVNMLVYNEYISNNATVLGALIVQLGPRTYRISRTLYFKAQIHIRGTTAKGDYAHAGSVLSFPPNVPGLHFYNFSDYNSSWTNLTGGAGSVLEHFKLTADRFNFGTPGGWDGVTKADAIYAHGKIIISDVYTTLFNGSGLAWIGYGDGADVRGLYADRCQNGIWIEGGDTNAGVFQNCIIDCARFGIFEGSGLGNVHIGHLATGNGGLDNITYYNQTCVVQEAGKTYWIRKDDSPGGTGPIAAAQTTRPSTGGPWMLASAAPGAWYPVWGQVLYNGVVYNVVPGQEANMWTSEPEISPAVWKAAGAPGGGAYIKWVLNWQPYTTGGDYYAMGQSASNLFLNCYSEGVNYPNAVPPSYYAQATKVIGGINALNAHGAGYRASIGASGYSAYRAGAFDTVTSVVGGILGGSDNNNLDAVSWYYGDLGNKWSITYTGTSANEFKLNYNGVGDVFFCSDTYSGAKSWQSTDNMIWRMFFMHNPLIGPSYIQLSSVNGYQYISPGVGGKVTINGAWGIGDFVFNANPTDVGGYHVADGMAPIGLVCVANSTNQTGAQFVWQWGIEDSGRTVASLPNAGQVSSSALTYVTDALAPLVGCPVVGGGARKTLVRSTGSAWVVVEAPPLVTTVTGLPAASAANKGARAIVTDANATTFLSTVAGGGANTVPVMSNGRKWIIG